jgi:phosphohistidine swiveling domain-containing protein
MIGAATPERTPLSRAASPAGPEECSGYAFDACRTTCLKHDAREIRPATIPPPANRKAGHRSAPGRNAREPTIGLIATHQREIDGKQSPDLFGDRREQLLRRYPACDHRRETPQPRLLLNQPRQTGTTLRVRHRHRQQLRELRQPLTRVGRQTLMLLPRSNDHDAPQAALDEDWRPDRRADAGGAEVETDRGRGIRIVVDPCRASGLGELQRTSASLASRSRLEAPEVAPGIADHRAPLRRSRRRRRRARALLRAESSLHRRLCVRARRAQRERYLALELPNEWRGVAEPIVPQVDPDTEVIEGIAASPGIVQGRARVVADPTHAFVQSGEILVARDTDQGWASLMFISTGLIAEMGGVMSHTADVARELSIPCVVGTRHARAPPRTLA